MRKLIASFRVLMAAFFLVLSMNVTAPISAHADSDKPVCPVGTGLSTQGNNCKITICHRTNSDTNPYTVDTVSYDAATGALGNDNGKGDHTQHTGPVFDNTVTYPSPHNGDQWGDIIPAIPAPINSPGLNWNTAGMAIFANGCNVPPTQVTPATVTFDDQCATANDTFTVPTTPGVIYSVSAGSHSGSGLVNVTASAASGYTLTGTTSWSHLFTNVACPVPDTHVTPAEVTFNDVCGTANDTFTVPTTTGVNYSQTAGSHSGSGSTTVTATAQTGYILDGTTSWSHTFTNVACPIHVTPAEVTFNDVCGTANDTFTVPTTTGVNYSETAGTHSGTGSKTVTATAQTGYILDGTTSWSHTFTNVACDQHATPGTVTFNDQCGTQNDSFFVPTTTGVNYSETAGTHSGSGSTTVTATAQQGYVLDGTTSWSHDFNDEACPSECPDNELQSILREDSEDEDCPVDVCPNIEGNQSEIPDGAVKDNFGNCITPGRGGGETPPTEVVTTIAPVTPTGGKGAAELVNTGSSVLLNVSTGLFILGVTAGMTITTRRRQYS
jgi:hypothetical protein